jgi:YVTN family beta-propeller protein
LSKYKAVSYLMNEDYISPISLEVSKDGKSLYVVGQDADALLVVDLGQETVRRSIRVGDHPHSVKLDEKNGLAFVSNQWSDHVSVIDLASSIWIDTIPTGNGPSGLELSPDGSTLYTVNTFSSDLSVIDIITEKEIKRLRTGTDPTGIASSGDAKTLYVGSRRAWLSGYGEPISSELTVIDQNKNRLRERKQLDGAYMMENIAFTPEGDLAISTLIRPKNNLPSVQVEQGWMMTHGISVMEQGGKQRTIQLLLDEPNAYYPDPYDIVISSDGKKAFVTNSGVDMISVVSIDSIRTMMSELDDQALKALANDLGASARYVLDRIKTGANPKGMALSPDAKVLYVAEMLEDRILMIDTKSHQVMGSVDLGGPERVTVLRKGRRLFSNASHTFQNQYSCYTCHPDYHEDGLVYNMAASKMGRNLANTQSLREIGETAPFKWNGKNQTVYKQDGIRFSTVLTRTEQFSYPDLDAISAYIMRGIEQPPNLMHNPDGLLTASQQRGKEIFERKVDNLGEVIPENNRCNTCHPAPYFTNRQLSDVSTLSPTDDPVLFDTPHLTNVFASPPYLHDGKAMTLEEIWTVYAEDDKHGRVNDLSKTELNDLVNYLKSIRSPEYESNEKEVQYGAVFHK